MKTKHDKQTSLKKRKAASARDKQLEAVFLAASEKASSAGDVLACMLKGNGFEPNMANIAIKKLVATIRALAAEDILAAKFVYETAQQLTGDIVKGFRDGGNNQKWFLHFAKSEYEMPWIMINGKPAPNFPNATALLKRGKSNFTSPHTKAVAEIIWNLTQIQESFLRTRSSALPKDISWGGYILSAEKLLMLSELGPFSEKTKLNWWPLVKSMLQENPQLSHTERDNIRRTIDHDTDKALMSEYLKRCKKALSGLCPEK